MSPFRFCNRVEHFGAPMIRREVLDSPEPKSKSSIPVRRCPSQRTSRPMWKRTRKRRAAISKPNRGHASVPTEVTAGQIDNRIPSVRLSVSGCRKAMIRHWSSELQAETPNARGCPARLAPPRLQRLRQPIRQVSDCRYVQKWNYPLLFESRLPASAWPSYPIVRLDGPTYNWPTFPAGLSANDSDRLQPLQS